MTLYLTGPELLAVAEGIIGPPKLADRGLLEAAAARPSATDETGREIYPTLLGKAAALLQAIVTFRPLERGNEQLGIEAARVFLYLNGLRLGRADPQIAALLVDDIVSGALTDVDLIAVRLRALLG